MWEAWEKNKKLHNAGFVSSLKLDLTNLDNYIDGYGATFIKNENTTRRSYSLEEMRQTYKRDFNVLVSESESPDFF